MINQKISEQSARSLRYLQPIAPDAVTGLARQVYEQIEMDSRLVAPLTLHTAAPPILAGVWSILRETLWAGQVDRPLKEAVAAAVSRSNQCPYCVDVHSFMLHASAKSEIADAIQQERYDDIRDPHLRAVVRWALATRSPDAAILADPPFAPLQPLQTQAAEMIGTAVAFHYINRMVNVFLGASRMPLLSDLTGLAGRIVGRVIGKQVVGPPLTPGDSLKFLPVARLPADMSWAAPNSTIADAFAGFVAIVEEAGATSLPEAVRVVVREHIALWNGEDMGISRRWVEPALAGLEEADRAAARLALLTALAPYQVDSRIVEAYRLRYPADAELVAATAWASLTAARRIGSWLGLSSKLEPIAPGGNDDSKSNSRT